MVADEAAMPAVTRPLASAAHPLEETGGQPQIVRRLGGIEKRMAMARPLGARDIVVNHDASQYLHLLPAGAGGLGLLSAKKAGARPPARRRSAGALLPG